jgi:hypothetical protein
VAKRQKGRKDCHVGRKKRKKRGQLPFCLTMAAARGIVVCQEKNGDASRKLFIANDLWHNSPRRCLRLAFSLRAAIVVVGAEARPRLDAVAAARPVRRGRAGN